MPRISINLAETPDQVGLPEGTFPFRIKSIVGKKTKETRKDMTEWTFVVTRGKFKGQEQKTWIVEGNMGEVTLKQILLAIGYRKDQNIDELNSDRLLGKEFMGVVKLQKGRGDDEDQLYARIVKYLRMDDGEEEEEEERPRSRRSRDNDDDEDDRPRNRRRRDVDDEEEDAPRTRRSSTRRDEDDEEEEDDRPRRSPSRRSRDDDEEGDEERESDRRSSSRSNGRRPVASGRRSSRRDDDDDDDYLPF